MLRMVFREVEVIPIVHIVEIYCVSTHRMTERNRLSIRWVLSNKNLS